MKDEIIEAMARAMIRTCQPDRDFLLNPFYAEEMARFTPLATAAFNACMERLREPTPEMVEAGGFVDHPADCEECGAYEYDVGDFTAARVWQAMLNTLIPTKG